MRWFRQRGVQGVTWMPGVTGAVVARMPRMKMQTLEEAR
jgi:hypothetical protein